MTTYPRKLWMQLFINAINVLFYGPILYKLIDPCLCWRLSSPSMALRFDMTRYESSLSHQTVTHKNTIVRSVHKGSICGLLNRQYTWWRHQMETFSALLALCAGNSQVTGEFPAQRPVTRRFDVSLICVWINGWVNNPEAGDLRRYRAQFDVTVMQWDYFLMHVVLVQTVKVQFMLYSYTFWLGIEYTYKIHIIEADCHLPSLD